MTTTPVVHANGTTHPHPPSSVPLVPRWPVGPWPRCPVFPQPPAGAQLLPLAGRQDATPATRVPWRPRIPAVDGDTVITWSMTAVVSAVILFAAIVSYSHIHALAVAHGEDPVQSHLLPLSIDGVIAEASLVMLFAARHKPMRTPPLARVMLWAGIIATLGANALVALPASWISPVASAVIGAVLSAWPAAAFIGSVELVMRLVRDVRAVASARDSDVRDDVASPAASAPPATSQRRRRRATRDAPPRNPRRKPATRSATPPATTGTADPVVVAIKDHDAWKAGRKLTRDDKDVIAETAGVTRRSVERCLSDARRMGTVKG